REVCSHSFEDGPEMRWNRLWELVGGWCKSAEFLKIHSGYAIANIILATTNVFCFEQYVVFEALQYKHAY
ncbi:MAG: hypothetical protein ABW185_17880, partial [Sedimenticola sp.]